MITVCKTGNEACSMLVTEPSDGLWLISGHT